MGAIAKFVLFAVLFVCYCPLLSADGRVPAAFAPLSAPPLHSLYTQSLVRALERNLVRESDSYLLLDADSGELLAAQSVNDAEAAAQALRRAVE
jgi:hypothetical protein